MYFTTWYTSVFTHFVIDGYSILVHIFVILENSRACARIFLELVF
jgi:hypothetical protein